LLLAGAVIARNWVAVQLVLVTFCTAVLSGLLFLRTAVAAGLLSLYRSGAIDRESLSDLGKLFSGFDPSVAHNVWVSDYFLLAAAVFVVVAVPFGLAYWLTKFRELVITALMGAAALVLWSRGKGLVNGLLLIAAWWLLVAVVASPIANYWKTEAADRVLKRNNRLSHALLHALVPTCLIVAIALIDSLGQNLRFHGLAWTVAKVVAFLTPLLALGKRVAPLISNFTRGGRPRISVSLIAGVGSVLLVVVLIAVLSKLTYDLNDAIAPPWQDTEAAWCQGLQLPSPEHRGWAAFWGSRMKPTLWEFLGFVAFAAILGQTLSFLNRSSLQSLYGARLTRAYLGASNPARWEEKGMRITESIDGDAARWEDYRPDRYGGPLHLINTTINETIDGRSQVEQRDRKGLPLTLGPFGLSAGVRHHALWKEREDAVAGKNLASVVARIRRRRTRVIVPLPREGFRVFVPDRDKETIDVENLGLGDWVGISGAAFSTGIGYRTSLGLSLLAGMANVRLGYWWNSGVNPARREEETPPPLVQRLARRVPLFPVQRLLLLELLARFPGTARRWWYLSDGGHFENTGGYELIRRRLPLIILLDNGADPDCMLEDLGNLVRKARLDFQTEIRFAGEEHEGRVLRVSCAYEKLVGTLAQLRPARSASTGTGSPYRFAARHIAAGVVQYPGNARGLLLVVKPGLVGDEPSDILQYVANHPKFPQEPTSDQFFDEAQWESYRKLGEHIGAELHELLKSLESAQGDFNPDAVLK
jgi:hypothetical protein